MMMQKSILRAFEIGSMQKNIQRALEVAEHDWHADAGEHRREPGGVLDNMFKVSGFSSRGVPRDPDDKVPDWCGMAVASWLITAGLNKGFNTSFLHVYNVEAFFTYGRQRNVNPRRLDTEIKVLAGWRPIDEYHDEVGSPRRWLSRHAVARLVAAGSEDVFAPGDVMLIDWSGHNDADHITLVRAWDAENRHLVCFEGNRSGLGPKGERRVESVVCVTYDLSDPRTLVKIYGVGRVSALDFGFEAVR